VESGYDPRSCNSNKMNERINKKFTEELAKKLYEELLVKYLNNSPDEDGAAKKTRGIIRK
jgi:hypothetical protein